MKENKFRKSNDVKLIIILLVMYGVLVVILFWGVDFIMFDFELIG